LVLLHGFMLSHHSFFPVLPRLAAAGEVIAIDLPGHGESDRPPPAHFGYDAPAFAAVVGEVLDALELPSVLLLGHSMGGGVALALAAREPARVARLVLIAPPVYPLPIPFEGKLLLAPRVGAFLWKNVLSKADIRRVMRRDDVRDPALITEEYLDYYWARFNRAGAREASYASLTALARLTNNNADPGRVRAPTLIVWGEEDRKVPLAQGKRLQRAIAGARLDVVPVCGHIPQLERPDELLRVIEPFLAEPAAQGASTTPVPPQRVGRTA
jgi:pimeloyl-ACP methyl ester carboxylesterase